jgi:DNA-binding response OmpR family regulator/KaiC/GvpD/RAD55 family RecA-like ATPase
MISTGFTSLDRAIGGLSGGKDYLVHGAVGSAKTAFGMNFLHAGLRAGEVVALITRRSPRMVFDHGRSFGWDLETFARDSQFVLLEYTPQILQNTSRAGDERRIIAELQQNLEGMDVRRMVFDPFGPMLEGTSPTNVAFRCRGLLDHLSKIGSTNVFIMDTPESNELIHRCKDQFHGMMRLESLGTPPNCYRLTVERYIALQTHAQIDFQLRYVNGMLELSEAETASRTNDVGRRILTIVPPERVPFFRSALQHHYVISEASGPADGMAKIAATSPDLVIIDKEGREIDGLEICRTLRDNGLSLPIIVVGEHLRRARDRLETNAVGADACLQRPIDGRLLRLEIQKLLNRYSDANRGQAQLPDAKILADLKRSGISRTSDVDYFFQRVQREVLYCTENDLTFAVLLLRKGDNAQSAGMADCVSAAESLIREYDLILTGDDWVAVLLAEADENGAAAFLKGLQNVYSADINCPRCECFNQQSDFAGAIRRMLVGDSTVMGDSTTVEKRVLEWRRP